MTTRNYAALLAQFRTFKGLVLANRAACDNDFACQVHDNVVAILGDLCLSCAELIDLASATAREPDPAEKRELAGRLHRHERAMATIWSEPKSYVLGGWRHVKGDRFLNPVTGKIEPIGDAPVFQPIPAGQLCGLPAILDALAVQTMVTFDRVIVFWKTMPAGNRQDGPDAEILF